MRTFYLKMNPQNTFDGPGPSYTPASIAPSLLAGFVGVEWRVMGDEKARRSRRDARGSKNSGGERGSERIKYANIKGTCTGIY